MPISVMSCAPPTDPDHVSDDTFLGGRMSALQPRRGHRSGSDAVFLAAAIQAKAGDSVLEAGAGVGVASLCLAARIGDLRLTLVERDATLCALARTNCKRSGIEADIVEGDLTVTTLLEKHCIPRESFDHVFANPPFFKAGRTRTAGQKSDAHVMPDGDLNRWIRFLATVCKPNGTITLIHRPDALGDLLRALEGRFGDLRIFPLFPRDEACAERILIRGVKGSRKDTAMSRGLVLHQPDGSYTGQAEQILRHAAPLDF